MYGARCCTAGAAQEEAQCHQRANSEATRRARSTQATGSTTLVDITSRNKLKEKETAFCTNTAVSASASPGMRALRPERGVCEGGCDSATSREPDEDELAAAAPTSGGIGVSRRNN